MSSVAASERHSNSIADSTRDYLTIFVGGQIFGLPILQAQDVLGEQRVTRVPLAPPQIAGALNLRGRIVTAVNMRACLGMGPRQDNGKTMHVVVEHGDELYSLMIDKVGEVMSLAMRDYENNASTLDGAWRSVSNGIYRLKDKLLVVLDIPRLLETLESHTELEK